MILVQELGVFHWNWSWGFEDLEVRLLKHGGLQDLQGIFVGGGGLVNVAVIVVILVGEMVVAMVVDDGGGGLMREGVILHSRTNHKG